ncbi:TetR/AcrR family transcriptional regulator C-terminal domain-containing protein [Nocardiopsis sp. HNM0947]|uniref:TetR/AcrR family transcriptional regulator C-terminal domain-containing protein n=2 Tax=Nocardiopsis coralli TaxID=2772213 RepID=A0ABR9P4H3_9ACTN|nr:TetR/AcrR family transcriptional regulator C-terminal domain-containing protein [Nocardiopsis coralli]
MEGALLELVAERDLSRLSVSDVTRRARVHRTTFYEHYTDVHDVAASACTQMFDELVDATPVFRIGQRADAIDVTGGSAADRERGHAELTAVFAHIAEHAELYRALLGPEGSARVIDHLLRRINVAVHVNRVGTAATTHADDPEESPHDPAAALLSGALMGVITDWLRRGCEGTPEQLSAAVAEHFAGAVGRA